MKVLVNKCPYTGKIFEDNKKYAIHLQQLRRERKRISEEKRVRNEFEEWLAKEKENIVDPSMIGPWIIENQKKLMIACNAFGMHTWEKDRFFPETDKFTKFEISVSYSSCVSNSHSCPVGGVENWSRRDPTLPQGYPGWTGRVEGILVRDKKHMHSYPYGNICKLLRLHTGSGGGGNQGWGYGLSIYLDDWPVMGQAITFAKLSTGKV